MSSLSTDDVDPVVESSTVLVMCPRFGTGVYYRRVREWWEEVFTPVLRSTTAKDVQGPLSWSRWDTQRSTYKSNLGIPG